MKTMLDILFSKRLKQTPFVFASATESVFQKYKSMRWKIEERIFGKERGTGVMGGRSQENEGHMSKVRNDEAWYCPNNYPLFCITSDYLKEDWAIKL